MDWFGAALDGPLVVIRALHFAATAMTTGTLIFRAVVAGSAAPAAKSVAMIVRVQTLRVVWIYLAICVASGLIWFLLEAASMSGLSLEESTTSDVLLTVANETQFGRMAEIRCLLAAILAGCLALDGFAPVRGCAVAISLALIAAIAWTGHAGSTVGELGILHLAADAFHLVAAAAWIGGLASLVLLLSVAMRDQTHAGVSFARDATQRFSTMGIAIVVTVFATGLVNTWILVGSLQALVATGYGQLVMLKVALFAAMLSFAAANRFWLTPRLALSSASKIAVQRRLVRNSTIEIALALMILAIVGVLGTLQPAIQAA